MKPFPRADQIKSILIANRGEIAIRVMRAATELGIRTVAIHSQEDRFSLHRTKADESYLVGEGKGPDRGVSRHRRHHSHRVRGARRRRASGLRILVGKPGIRRGLRGGRASCSWAPCPTPCAGSATRSRRAILRQAPGVPVMPATPPLPAEEEQMLAMAACRRLSGHAEGELGRRRPRHAHRGGRRASSSRRWPPRGARRKAAFGNDEVYLEKLIRRARHVEVQILGDAHGNLVHLYERDCTVQRRNQKVVERAPAVFLTERAAQRAVRGGAQDRPRRPTIARPARSSSCRTPTPASSTSSRSTRASRSSTRSPSASPASIWSRRRSASPPARASARRRAACRGRRRSA